MAVSARFSQRCLLEASGGGAKQWAEILALAKSKPGIINLGQGFPDFKGSAAAVEGAQRAMGGGAGAEAGPAAPVVEQYSPIPGSERLRHALSACYAGLFPAAKPLDPASEVCITTSGTEALLGATMGLVDPGDEVVFFEPFFPWYLPSIRLAGGVPKVVTLRPPHFDLLSVEAELRAAFSERTKLIIFNTPHNPTGHVASAAELELLADLCRQHDAICVSDEVYEACLFPPNVHRRMCEEPGMWDRTLTIGSASKLLSLTGWRVGWVTGPADLVAATRTFHAYSTFCAPTPLQEGVAAALEYEAGEGQLRFDDRAELMAGNHALLTQALEAAGVQVAPAGGGYFLVGDVAAYGMTDMEYCRWLATEHGVAAVPLKVFYCPAPPTDGEDATAAAGEPRSTTLVRFAVCKERETMEAAATRIAGATADSARAWMEAQAAAGAASADGS